MDLIPDLPSGPLDIYRNGASFNWKKMKLFIESPERIKLVNEAYHFLETEPLFQHPTETLTLEQERALTIKRVKKILSSKIFLPDDLFVNPFKLRTINFVLGIYDWSLVARKSLLMEFGISGIFGLGTERHMKYIPAAINYEMGFAFCLTEISHGTNTKAMKTEARYNKERKSFIIHTPNFEAAKCWAGNLGKTASHCLVFAQLYTPDGACHGLHCFIVPVRDPQTLTPYPGVTIIDMGSKLGLNGVDNGIVIFNHYEIPKDNLLNKIGDITDDGRYVSPIKDSSKRLGASLGNLSAGRVAIVSFGVTNLTKALTIGLRYSAYRKQFGPTDDEELPVLEYPLQQYRLLPYLAALYTLHFFSVELLNVFTVFRRMTMENDKNNNDILASYGQEIHALSCVGKPISGWLARDAIQECREACGGHGYLKIAGFGYLRDDNDANCTYEGDNNVLLQQTSNWLLYIWSSRHTIVTDSYPMKSIDFITGGDRILKSKWNPTKFQQGLADEVIIDHCLDAYVWLICWLCSVTAAELENLTKKFENNFHAKNNCQIFRAHPLALVYGERVQILCFQNAIKKTADRSLIAPLQRLCLLFALTRLMKHIPVFVEGGLLSGCENIISDIQNHIKRLLREITPDAVSLIDVFAPPDFIIRSALGKADGKVYEHMYQAMITSPGALTRDLNWQEISYNLPSKL